MYHRLIDEGLLESATLRSAIRREKSSSQRKSETSRDFNDKSRVEQAEQPGPMMMSRDSDHGDLSDALQVGTEKDEVTKVTDLSSS